jgi:hypothetical protein
VSYRRNVRVEFAALENFLSGLPDIIAQKLRNAMAKM